MNAKPSSDQEIDRRLLVGTWQLVSYETVDQYGELSHPLGRHASGYIIYTDDGYVSVHIAAPGREPFAGADLAGGETEEAAAAAKTYSAYCGRYEVKHDRIIHRVDVSLFPNWTGTAQERKLRIEGNRLILSTDPILINGAQRSARLVWERVGAPALP